MIKATFQTSEQDVKRRLGELSYKANIVMCRAANRALGTTTKSMGQEAAKRYRIKYGDVKKTIKTQKASYAQPYARFRSTDAHINLGKFGVTPNRPLRFTKKKQRSPKVYKAAVEKKPMVPLSSGNKPFVAVMKNGHQGLFRRQMQQKGLVGLRQMVRKRRKRGGRRTDNLIEGVYGPSVPQMLQNTEIMEIVQNNAKEMMEERIEHEISLLLDKKE